MMQRLLFGCVLVLYLGACAPCDEPQETGFVAEVRSLTADALRVAMPQATGLVAVHVEPATKLYDAQGSAIALHDIAQGEQVWVSGLLHDNYVTAYEVRVTQNP